MTEPQIKTTTDAGAGRERRASADRGAGRPRSCKITT